jgi:HEAT repeat protein
VDAVARDGSAAIRVWILEALEHPDWGARWAGLLAIAWYGPPDAALASSLARRLAHDEPALVRRTAALAASYALGEDPALETALEEAARRGDPELRAVALRTLGMRPGRDGPRLALLAEALQDADGEARAAAARGLARIELQELPRAQVNAEILRALAGALGDERADVRAYAAMALGRAGGWAAPYVAAMLLLLDDEKDLVRTTAADALGNVGAPAVPGLAAALRADDGRTAPALLWALRRAGPAGVSALKGGLVHPREGVRVEAARTLWDAGEAAERADRERALAVVVASLASADADVLRRAALAVARIGPGAASAVPALERLEDHPDRRVRQAAGDALARVRRPDR